ncbi:pilus assembly protein CpaF [Lachnospiraceae bacterium XBB1006]|nr:pilus assembly protein CpaF [Lachnospiraceae bacterium XBB1006]
MEAQVELTKEQYGPLWKYVVDEEVSDIDCIREEVWVTKGAGQRVRVPEQLTPDFVGAFCQKIATMQRKNFNPMSPLLEAETKNLRISILHEAVSIGGRSISIRKSLPKQRFDEQSAVANGYATKEMLDFLIACVKARFTFVICGNPGSGKTECAKFLAGKIPPQERIITVEDNLEWHLKQIHPESDVLELKVDKDDEEGNFSYRDAIKASLRQNPKWLMLSEARGREARQLLEAWSTGIAGMTTIHTDSVLNIPERILNMVGDFKESMRMENQIYNDIDVGILIGFARTANGRQYRRIEQICLYGRKNNRNETWLYVRNGKEESDEIPDSIQEKLEKAGILER